MKSIKLALLGGAALAVTAAGAQADDLDALKAQIEALNARVAAMEAAPSVPAGYQLLTISEGELPQVPGLGMKRGDMLSYGNKATVISVMPTADAPAGTTITWTGQVRAGVVYNSFDRDVDLSFEDPGDANEFMGGSWLNSEDVDTDITISNDDDDIDVPAQARLRVVGTTDTAVGEVGVAIEFRGDFNGTGRAHADIKEAWGWWAMTPELTFGGGYTASLGDIWYGYDGACSCYWVDNADMAFNPGDTSQLRLTYASGPLSMAIAVEDAGANDGYGEDDDNINGDKLGVAGEIKYSSDTISGEISGVYRAVDEDEYWDVDSLWQIGAGLGFALGDVANLSLAAAMGEGPATKVEDGDIVDASYVNNKYWGITALASFNLTDEVHAELAGGYKHRETDESGWVYSGGDWWEGSGIDYDTYAIMGGIYYTPVEQLTIGVEGEWYTVDAGFDLTEQYSGDKVDIDVQSDTFYAAFTGVWRF
ncbi:hypothetical protein [Aestuariivirga sp.]|uniref:hypothetical protein n=1 Tax=Aestuariivirga sp. TaxID=2650926 RepID=UPI003919EDFC